MAILRFNTSSPIEQIALRRSDSGGRCAYLIPNSDFPADKLRELISPIRENCAPGSPERNWQIIPMEVDGKAALEIRGYGSDKSLLNRIEALSLTQDKPVSKTQEPSDKFSIGKFIHNRALLVSGALYLIGDISFYLYGKFGKHKNGEEKKEAQFAGMAYAFGSVMLMLFSRDPSSQQLRDISQSLSTGLQKHGVTIDDSTALGRLSDTEKLSSFSRVDNFMRKYHSEAMAVGFGASGIAQVIGARKDLMHNPHAAPFDQSQHILNEKQHDRFVRTNAMIDYAVGVTTATASALTIGVPEKGEDELAKSAKETNPFKRAINWFTDKPLRISGYGLMGSTVLHSVSSYRNWKMSNEVLKLPGLTEDSRDAALQEKKSFGFRSIFVITNLIAEMVMTLGSKGHGAGVASGNVFKSTCSLAAEIIEKQPEEKREQLTRTIAELLASPKALGGKAEDYLQPISEARKAYAASVWAPSQPPQATAQSAVLEVQIAQQPDAPSKWTARENVANRTKSESFTTSVESARTLQNNTEISLG